MTERHNDDAATAEVTTVVVKVVSRCNLACKYCYVYEHADQSWRAQPRYMSPSVVRQLAYRLAEYGTRNGRLPVTVVLHGGEPMLYGPARLRALLAEVARSMSEVDASVFFAMQTNATATSPAVLDVLAEYKVSIGVSVDATRESHDRMRVTALGRPTSDRVRRGVDSIRAHAGLEGIASTLSVIDPTVDAVDALAHLSEFGAPLADFLLPDWNHDTYPGAMLPRGSVGEWLCSLFDAWINSDSSVQIRIFHVLMRLLLGGKLGMDFLGAKSFGTVVVETDGSYHVHDALKTAYEGASATGLTLETSSIADVCGLPLMRAMTDKASGASSKCLSCPYFQVCGGGHLVHRYSEELGFDRESVYCQDMIRLIGHIYTFLQSQPGHLPLVGFQSVVNRE